MRKKNRQHKRQAVLPPAAASPDEAITPLGKKVIGIGVAVIVLGFIVLSKADPMGRNWAAHLSPFLILGGYILVGAGIFFPEKLPTFQQPQSPSPGLSSPEKTT